MSVVDRVLLAGGAAALLLAGLAGWLLVAPTGGVGSGSDVAIVEPSFLASVEPIATASTLASAPELVVDVEGGVQAPGLQRLPPDARVADAIAAAGGYSSSADLDEATRALNLAAPLTDGQQVYVPLIGDDAPAQTASEPATAGSSGTSGSGGLVNLNTATPEELEALPGIGPVTVQKIVAARQERPFASLEEAVEREVLNRGQLEDIRDLATAG
jgi:competence protein ComEA